MSKSVTDYLLDPDLSQARFLGGDLTNAVAQFRQFGAAESLQQELWSLVRRITPFLLPGPLPSRIELRKELDQIEYELAELREQAAVPEEPEALICSWKINRYLTEHERLGERLIALRKRPRPESAADCEEMLAILKKRARIRTAILNMRADTSGNSAMVYCEGTSD